MKKRQTSDDERAFFEGVMTGKLRIAKPEPRLIMPEAVVRKGPKPAIPSGIDGGTAERLHRGDLAPQATLDLHGLTEAAAYPALMKFITMAIRRNLRLVLVITGKGRQQIDRYAPFDMELDMRSRGVLKNMVPRWLAEPDVVRQIADIRTAHGRHGGDGALYIYLRKKSSDQPRFAR